MMKNNPNSRDSLSRPRLLVVEPDFAQLRPVLDRLRQEDYRVTVCACRDAALEHLPRIDFGVVVINLHPTRADDAEWLKRAIQLNPRIHVILYVSGPACADTQAALNQGAFGWVERDDLEELIAQVHRAFGSHYRANVKRAATGNPAAAADQAAASEKARLRSGPHSAGNHGR